MISVFLLPGPLLAEGVDTPVRLCLRNTSSIACINVVVEFETPNGLVLVDGDRLIELHRLRPQQQYEHAIRIRATRRFAGAITLPSFSYFDVNGDAHDAAGAIVEFAVGPAPVAQPPSPPPLPKRNVVGPASIFISYRSTDNPWFVSTIVDRFRSLRSHPVFVDVDGLRGGEDWRARLDSELQRCGVLLALVGPTWSSASDVLQWEIAVALDRGIPVIPVLFDDAHMPRTADLPNTMRKFADRHAVRVESRTKTRDLMHLELLVGQNLIPSVERGRSS